MYYFIFGYLYNTNDSVKYGIDRLMTLGSIDDEGFLFADEQDPVPTRDTQLLASSILRKIEQAAQIAQITEKIHTSSLHGLH